MTIGPEPMRRIFLRSVRFGIVDDQWPAVVGHPEWNTASVGLGTSYQMRRGLQEGQQDRSASPETDRRVARGFENQPHRHQVKEQLIYQEMGSPFRIAC